VLRQMKHRSVVPIYGFSFVETDEKRPFIVLPWSVSLLSSIFFLFPFNACSDHHYLVRHRMASGSAHLYLKNHPQANRIRIVSVSFSLSLSFRYHMTCSDQFSSL
jgi:hypothetical protein